VSEQQLQTALDESLLPAMFAGSAAAFISALIVASLVGNRLLRPIDELRLATRRMAAGDYAVEVPVPSEIELASLAHDFNDLGATLATTEERRRQLVGEVTHELRTPITVIRGQMEGLIDGVIEPSDGVYVTVADEAARMQRLVDDLELLSRADEGALEVETAELDLAQLAERAAGRLRPQFEHEQVSLTLAGSEHPVVVPGDSDRLTQVVTNLLGNALEHTPTDGTVTVRSGSDATEAWVEVSDTGTGIRTDEVERVFDRFYRGTPATTPTDRPGRPGRGIGLTIARSLARAHGGDIEATSRGPGKGSVFRLTIPRGRPNDDSTPGDDRGPRLG
jgi:signal transduction histidine kinase